MIPQLVLYSLAIAFLCSLRYWNLISGRCVFSSPVHVRYLEPTVVFLQEQFLANGKLPSWNPYAYLGMPQLSGCLPGSHYPFTYLFMYTGYETACVVFLVLHQLIGFTGIYLLVRRYTEKVVSRLVAASIYLLLDIVLVGDANLALAATLAWLPLCIYGLVRCKAFPQGATKPHAAGLVVVNCLGLGALFLSGAVGYALVLMALFVAVIMCQSLMHKIKRSEKQRPAIVSFLIGTALGVCLGGPVLFPYLEWALSDSLPRTWANLFRPIPLCVSFSNVFSGPDVIARSTHEEVSQKAAMLIKSMRAVSGHQGRYLMILPKEQSEIPLLFRMLLPAVNVKNRMASPLGYLGHPSDEYRRFYESTVGGDLASGYIDAPANLEASTKLLRFMRMTSTALAVSPNWPFDGHVKMGFNDWRRFIEPLSAQPESWHCFQQTIVTPAAYAIDAWHWVKDTGEIVRDYFGKEELDPRMTLLVEKNAHVEVDEEKLDKMPFSQVTPPVGPPLTDAATQRKSENETAAKAVEIMAYEPEHVALSVRVSRPSFIVVTDTYYPGWKAYVDGVPCPCYRANAVGRAVFVPEGSHLVTFDYLPRGLKWGSQAALGGLAIAFVLTFFWLARWLGKVINLLSVGKFE